MSAVGGQCRRCLPGNQEPVCEEQEEEEAKVIEVRKSKPLPSASSRCLHVSAPSPLVFVSRGVHVLLVLLAAPSDARLEISRYKCTKPMHVYSGTARETISSKNKINQPIHQSINKTNISFCSSKEFT